MSSREGEVMQLIRAFVVVLIGALSFGTAIAAAGPAAHIALAQSAVVLDGTYDVHGTNRNGSKYTGTAVVGVNVGKVSIVWLITGGQTYKGKGTLKNGRMVVDFGSRYPVIYTVGENGVLHGTWDKGRASETLIPQK